MNIKILHMVEGAKEATGIAVIIDVFRAFTVEAYLMNNGAEKLIPVGDMQIAYDYKEKDSNLVKTILIAVSVIVILLIGFSRIYLGVHYFSDVIGGYLLGTAYFMIFLTIIKAVDKKWK